MLDESLDVLTRFWSGEPVTFQGDHVAIHGATLHPRPVQRPRIPIWVGGCLHLTGPRERALRWEDLDAETEYVTGLARAGATWWHEYIPPSTPLATAKARIEAGPVRAVG